MEKQMKDKKKESVREICDKGIAGIHIEERLLPEQIPALDLYMDQLITLFESSMPHQRRTPDDKLITKPMVNNYIKNKLLPPADRKKYNQDHLMKLSMLTRTKQCANLEDIRRIYSALPDDISALYPEYLKIAGDLDADLTDYVNNAAGRIDEAELDEKTAAALAVQFLYESSAELRRLAEALSDRLLVEETPPEEPALKLKLQSREAAKENKEKE